MGFYEQLLGAADRLTNLGRVNIGDKLGSKVDWLLFLANAFRVCLDAWSINTIAKLSWLTYYWEHREIKQVSLGVSIIFEEVLLMAQAEPNISSVAEVTVWNQGFNLYLERNLHGLERGDLNENYRRVRTLKADRSFIFAAFQRYRPRFFVKVKD